MDPTTSYKAHRDASLSSADDTPKAPPRTKSRFMEPTAAFRAHTDTPSASSSSPAAAAASPTLPPRAKSAGGKEGNVLGSLTRHASLRMPKKTSRLTSSELSKGEGGVTKNGGVLSKMTSSKKVAPADSDSHLATVAENLGAEEREIAADKDRSASLLKRIGIVKSKEKTSPSSTTPTKKTVIVSSAQARTGQDKKK